MGTFHNFQKQIRGSISIQKPISDTCYDTQKQWFTETAGRLVQRGNGNG